MLGIGLLNDLWQFDGSQWTWMGGSDTTNQRGVYGTKGVASLSNVPGARQNAVSWTDNSGTVWLFGGYGFAASSDGTLVVAPRAHMQISRGVCSDAAIGFGLLVDCTENRASERLVAV